MRMCFCFVLLSLALFYLSRVISCLLLRVSTYLAIIVTIFTFFSKHDACAHLHSCRRAHARVYFFFSLAPILPTSAYVVFDFPAGSRFTHTHLRICIRAATHMRMFPYILGEFRI